jgi:predicted type IV restriction endonuclease
MAIPKRVAERIVSALKRLVPIIQQQQARDVSEADTVTLVKDVMAEVFGFDKYAELTSEHAIRGTFCDLAVRIDDKLVELVEVKGVGFDLNDRHLKQAVDYAANQGIEWVILTNGAVWRLHHVIFGKPIDHRLILCVDLTQVDWRKADDLEAVYAFTREGLLKGAPAELRDRQDATSRFIIAALLLQNGSVKNALRRELRRVVDVNVTDEEIAKVLEIDVIKREALEGPAASQAVARVRRAGKKVLRESRDACDDDQVVEPLPDSTPAGDEVPVDVAAG